MSGVRDVPRTWCGRTSPTHPSLTCNSVLEHAHSRGHGCTTAIHEGEYAARCEVHPGIEAPYGQVMTTTDDRRVWLITGAATGLGRAIAEAAAECGDQVVATDRDLAGVKSWAGSGVHPVHLDVTDRPSVDRAVAEAVARFGRIDVLVNNAGFGVFGSLEELPEEQVRRQFETNVFGMWNVTRAVLPHLRERRGGHIVQMSSLDGVAPEAASETAYAGSKFAVEGISEVLAMEVAHLGIKVTIVEPGAVRSDFGASAVIQPVGISDYDDTVGKAVAWFESLIGKQPNDPRRVAVALLRAIDSPDPPLHLVLGPEAVQAVRDKLDAQRRELEAWAEVGADTAFPVG
jgi:NAD(P)-dependent dehydrogenase (short-subunit alcohol dehydrogenase family)